MFDDPSQQLRHALEQVTSVTLPKIYREIGRRVAKSPKPARGLEQHFQAIARLKPAAEAKDPAAVAELRAAYGALGKAAYELYGDKAVGKDVAPLLADALAKQQSYRESLSKQAQSRQPIAQAKRRSLKLLAYAVMAITVAVASIVACVVFPKVIRHTIAVRRDVPTASPEQEVVVADKTPASRRTPAAAVAIERVARPASNDPDPGWTIQALHRTMRSKNLRADTPLGCMLDAYQKGRGGWKNPDGTNQSLSSLGLPAIDWHQEPAVTACHDPDAAREPYIGADKEEAGTRLTLSPVVVLDGLLCSVSFLVIDDTPANARAVGLDFLAVQVELFGVDKDGGLATHDQIRPDTFVDFWSSRRNKRYTITRWRESTPAGHITVQTYGPLLFEVLSSDPDFLLIEGHKFVLPSRFRSGCKTLCEKVLQLRREQGHNNPPTCRAP